MGLPHLMFKHIRSSKKKLNESVVAKKREGKVKGLIYELRAVVEDFRMQAVGGIEAAIDLYKSCIVPSLVFETCLKFQQKLDTFTDNRQF